VKNRKINSAIKITKNDVFNWASNWEFEFLTNLFRARADLAAALYQIR
jgi:hypothetical protein